MSITHPQPEDSASAARPRSARRWLPLALVLLLPCLVVIHQRNRIRAYWWASCLVRTDDFRARGYYLASLAAVGDRAAGAIERLSRNDDPAVRVLAVFPIKSLPQEAALPALRRLLNDPDMDVRESAALALVFMSSSGARTVLQDMVASEERGAAAAVGALGRSQAPSDLEALCQALSRHPAPAVRAQAAESLAARLLEEALPGEPENLVASPHGCDPFLTLVRSLGDDATFFGPLSLEREIAAAARFARRQGRIGLDLGGTLGSAPTPRRSVADIAAKGLSSLTARVVTPQTDQSAAQQAVFADRCRRWYLQRRRHPRAGVENPPSTSSGSSDTPTEGSPESPDGDARN